ncbi:hypothetical protein GJAV_G00034580 [Gymnothorax javanicus]|nr:hypothetical protein GJAV_G00034580 [Gymnothorax javanicus]
MSLQVCGCCGWSKVTTYHGLRVHQGKMGCTPKGMRIPASQQSSINTYSPIPMYMGPPIIIEEPLYSFASSTKSMGERKIWGSLCEESSQKDSKPIQTISQKEINARSDQSLQVCSYCGWSKVTTYHGLRVHQGMMGCTPKGMRIPESQQPAINHYSSKVTHMGAPIKVKEPLDIFSHSKSEGEQKLLRNQWEESPKNHHQKDSGSIRSTPVSKEPFQTPESQTFHTQVNSGATRVRNQSLLQTATPARRALDFSACADQVGQLVQDLPRTSAQGTAVRPKENERKKEREAQKLLKARQDKMRADLQQKIHTREQKMAEVRSSVVTSEGSLDTEWQEINDVFSEVMRVVEDAKKKALQPIEERRHRLLTEAQDVEKKLQKEINKLKKTVNELDKNPNLQDSLPAGLDESQDWKNLTVDCSFSLGTLRSKTSKMMEQIQQKLEKLSSVELKRIPRFAVDVKLDPTTAHRRLRLSPDGKEVRDGGENLNVPDAPERFDMFGSVLGLNSLTCGKSYWEVEVGNKTGWDLGVARRDANRKGNLSLNPDNGYWVTVHYEDEKYAALTAPPVSLSLTAKPRKVGVFCDYEEGLVSFYDVTARSHIYSFTQCLFNDEIFPYFSPHLKANEKNSGPLIISVVKKQM